MDQGSKQRPSPRSLSQAFMQVWISIFGGIIFFFILFVGRELMAKLQCEIEPPCWPSLDRSASILGSGLIILIYVDVHIDHQYYFDNHHHHQPHNNYHRSPDHHKLPPHRSWLARSWWQARCPAVLLRSPRFPFQGSCLNNSLGDSDDTWHCYFDY